MNSILQRYEHFATWTKNIFILLIFCSLYNDIHRILQSGKHILAAHNEQKIVQSKVRRFYVVFRRQHPHCKKLQFHPQKSCKKLQIYLKKGCKKLQIYPKKKLQKVAILPSKPCKKLQN